MLTETLTEGLDLYEIGKTIRELRARKNLALGDLGKHTGLSAGMLSKIEHGHVYPTLPTLLRIAMVFGVGLDHFFAAEKDQPIREVVRSKDRLRLPNTNEGRPQFHFESLDYPVKNRTSHSYYAEFDSNRPSPNHEHPGMELIFIISGQLNLHFANSVITLSPGDSICFDAEPAHGYSREGTDMCKAVVTITER